MISPRLPRPLRNSFTTRRCLPHAGRRNQGRRPIPGPLIPSNDQQLVGGTTLITNPPRRSDHSHARGTAVQTPAAPRATTNREVLHDGHGQPSHGAARPDRALSPPGPNPVWLLIVLRPRSRPAGTVHSRGAVRQHAAGDHGRLRGRRSGSIVVIAEQRTARGLVPARRGHPRAAGTVVYSGRGRDGARDATGARHTSDVAPSDLVRRPAGAEPGVLASPGHTMRELSPQKLSLFPVRGFVISGH